MKKILKFIIILIIILVLALAIFTFFLKSQITGSSVQGSNDSYIYTKAICNESNYCADHEITYENNEVVKIEPITGAVVQFSENWTDPRQENQKQELC